jgi:predicted DCC family thiol-disulfide oxidoreductase YuxK
MPQALVYSDITCPYCYSNMSTEIDVSAGSQDYYEDCEVCCAPMELFIHVDDQGEIAQIDVKRGNG